MWYVTLNDSIDLYTINIIQDSTSLRNAPEDCYSPENFKKFTTPNISLL